MSLNVNRGLGQFLELRGMEKSNYQVTVCFSPAFQTTPLVGYVTGGAATSNGSAFTRQETYARARRVTEVKETMFTDVRLWILKGLEGGRRDLRNS